MNRTENLLDKIENLRIENDSLKNIVVEINEKYVFDSISIRDIPSHKNTYKLNSIVSGEVVLIGYNIEKKTNVIMIDSLTYNPKKLFNPDTLELEKGGFIYKAKLNADRIYLKGIIETKNKYGKGYEVLYNSTIGIKKN